MGEIDVPRAHVPVHVARGWEVEGAHDLHHDGDGKRHGEQRAPGRPSDDGGPDRHQAQRHGRHDVGEQARAEGVPAPPHRELRDRSDSHRRRDRGACQQSATAPDEPRGEPGHREEEHGRIDEEAPARAHEHPGEPGGERPAPGRGHAVMLGVRPMELGVPPLEGAEYRHVVREHERQDGPECARAEKAGAPA